MKKDRIISIVFMFLAFGFLVLYLREYTNHNLARIDLSGCEEHKKIMVLRVKKLQAQLAETNTKLTAASEAAKENAELGMTLDFNDFAEEEVLDEPLIDESEESGENAENENAETANNAEAEDKEVQEITNNRKNLKVSPEIVEARINAVNKIIELSAEQKAALEKYLSEKIAGQAPSQSFEDIIGSQNADFYYQQVRKSFDRAKQEQFEKEAYYMGNKIGMSIDQQKDLIVIMQQIYESLPKSDVPNIDNDFLSREDQLKKAKQYVKMQKDFELALEDRIKDVLNEDQFKKYLNFKAENSNRDLELWHD